MIQKRNRQRLAFVSFAVLVTTFCMLCSDEATTICCAVGFTIIAIVYVK